ncbi:MAG: LemA family protein [Candidatus Sumerlaea sp.]|uniref:LemA protein n=1 Tax=Sumerlaea chitinivorans TaxID=2250252 RepID=A0A2Z4Y2R5_SUMC1|nr:LemA protein [Candidatus Sumerlaea chitinivorans]MCX7963395.1 LemA family protein [Candidatus Sumerlaea chitinivorans]GIX45183.1 MAG: LemA family protein [Candidatus Sumerlaea sp.]
MTALIVVLVLLLIILFWVIGTYNSLIAMRTEVENAWAQIDVQLRRRYDLIPNLVETVKGYAAHERQTLEKVIQARAMAMQATGVAEKAEAENILTGTLKSLFALAEAYPNLKANENFLQLQEELASTENKIAFARQYYNDSVMRYNARIQQFPTNIIAGIFAFTKKEFFEVQEAAVREAPKVSF